MSSDSYKTIELPSAAILYKEKNSKFYGYAFPLASESEIKPLIDLLRRKHHTAGHFCYAFQAGTETISFRVNDDGEPNNSAGMPIYGQIQSFGITNVLVVVVRYFGGTKLGVGGLISAYRTAAQMAIEAAEIAEKTIDIHYRITFDYKNMNKVMRVIREKNLEIISQKMEESCAIVIAVRKKNASAAFEAFNARFEIKIEAV